LGTNYDCNACGAACCKHGLLPLVSKESQNMLLQHPLLAYFTSAYNPNFHAINRPARCWYLDEYNYCKIEKTNNYNDKPIFCRMYPFKVMLSNNKPFIHVVSLCPEMKISFQQGEELHPQITANAEELLKSEVVREIDIPLQRFELEKDIFQLIKKHLTQSCYIYFTTVQCNLVAKTGQKSSLEKKLNTWIDFLKISDLNLNNTHITYELIRITSIIRMLLTNIPIEKVPYILLALYIFMLIYNESNNNLEKSNYIFSYFSLLDVASTVNSVN